MILGGCLRRRPHDCFIINFRSNLVPCGRDVVSTAQTTPPNATCPTCATCGLARTPSAWPSMPTTILSTSPGVEMTVRVSAIGPIHEPVLRGRAGKTGLWPWSSPRCSTHPICSLDEDALSAPLGQAQYGATVRCEMVSGGCPPSWWPTITCCTDRMTELLGQPLVQHERTGHPVQAGLIKKEGS